MRPERQNKIVMWSSHSSDIVTFEFSHAFCCVKRARERERETKGKMCRSMWSDRELSASIEENRSIHRLEAEHFNTENVICQIVLKVERRTCIQVAGCWLKWEHVCCAWMCMWALRSAVTITIIIIDDHNNHSIVFVLSSLSIYSLAGSISKQTDSLSMYNICFRSQSGWVRVSECVCFKISVLLFNWLFVRFRVFAKVPL